MCNMGGGRGVDDLVCTLTLVCFAKALEEPVSHCCVWSRHVVCLIAFRHCDKTPSTNHLKGRESYMAHWFRGSAHQFVISFLSLTKRNSTGTDNSEEATHSHSKAARKQRQRKEPGREWAGKTKGQGYIPCPPLRRGFSV